MADEVTKTDEQIEIEMLREELAQKNEQLAKSSNTDADKDLAEARAKILELMPEVKPKAKPYTSEEIEEHKKSGHVIGAPNQKLSEGHDEEDLQTWDLWQCELKLKDMHIAEISKDWTVPDVITPMKIVKKGQKGNDKTFQKINKQIDFRSRAAAELIFYYFKDGSVESGKPYECHYWIETEGKGAVVSKHPRMLVKGVESCTGAPATK